MVGIEKILGVSGDNLALSQRQGRPLEVTTPVVFSEVSDRGYMLTLSFSKKEYLVWSSMVRPQGLTMWFLGNFRGRVSLNGFLRADWPSLGLPLKADLSFILLPRVLCDCASLLMAELINKIIYPLSSHLPYVLVLLSFKTKHLMFEVKTGWL